MRKKQRILEEHPVLPLPEKLLDVEAVARLLGIGRTRVFQLMKNDGLPHLKWGRTLRFHPHEIARWLAEQSA